MQDGVTRLLQLESIWKNHGQCGRLLAPWNGQQNVLLSLRADLPDFFAVGGLGAPAPLLSGVTQPSGLLLSAAIAARPTLQNMKQSRSQDVGSASR